MSKELNHNRRRFLRNATVALAAAELAPIGYYADAQSSQTSPSPVPQIRPGTNQTKKEIRNVNITVEKKKIQATSSFTTKTIARANRLS